MYIRILFIVLTLFIAGATSTYAQWFNTVGGNVHIEGDLDPQVPSGEYFSEEDPLIGNSGIITLTGTDSNMGGGSQSHPSGVVSTGVSPSAFMDVISRYDYNFFVNKFSTHPQYRTVSTPLSMGGCDVDGFIAGGITSGDIIRFTHSGGANMHSGACDLVVDESVIILVDHNITMRFRSVTVNPGRYFMMLSGQNIIMHSNIGSPGAPLPGGPLQGIYIAEGAINVQSSANLIRGAGVFVGQTDFILDRTGGDSTTPAEQFTYAPRFIFSAPSHMKRRRVSRWTNLAP